MPLVNQFGNLALDTSIATNTAATNAQTPLLQTLQRIAQLLKPLGVVTGGGSNRLNVDVNAITTLPTLSNVTTVSTVSTVTNQAQLGGVNAFAQIHDISRAGYNQAIRGKIS